MTRRRHAVKIEASFPRAPHTPRERHVIDCACGWQSPLCASPERADKLYEAHRKQKPRRGLTRPRRDNEGASFDACRE